MFIYRGVWGDRFLLLVGAIALVAVLLGCQSPDIAAPDNLRIYRNPRYGFEFPYPSNWVPAPPPANLDGRVFSDPDNPEASIRGFARQNLETANLKANSYPVPENFTTEQGLEGSLQTDIGLEISAMRLTLNRGEFQYVWEGRSPSEEFANYYRLFYTIARQYRVILQK